MLLLVIALVWLTVVTVVVAVCQAAARGDSARADERQPRGEPICDGLVVWDRATAASLRSEWLPARTRGVHAPAPRPAPAGSRRRPAATPR